MANFIVIRERRCCRQLGAAILMMFVLVANSIACADGSENIPIGTISGTSQAIGQSAESVNTNGSSLALYELTGEQPRPHLAGWYATMLTVVGVCLLVTSLVIITLQRQRAAQFKKLQESEERNGYLFDNAPDMFCSVDVETARIVECNLTLANKLGFTKEEILGRRIFDIYHEDSQPESQRCFATFQSTGKVTCENLRLLKRDGGFVDVSLRGTALRDDDGNIVRSLSVWRDITDLRQAEEQARSSHERLTGILRNVPEAIIAMDDRLDLQVFNKAAERIFGYTAEEVIGKPLDILMPTRFRMGHGKHVRSFTESSDAYRLMSERQDIQALRKDGTEFPATASVTRAILNGEPVFTVILQDVTERRAAEKALREKTESLDDAQRIAHMGSWEWDIATDKTYCSDEVYRVFGFDPKDPEVSYSSFVDAVHPDDQEMVNTAVRRSLGNPDIPLDLEHRIVRKDGEERVVHKRGEVILGTDQKAIGVKGTTQDITETKRSEAQLIHSAKLAIVGQMASGIAHELNQPLHIIRLTADLAALRKTENPQPHDGEEDYLAKISEQVERMGEIINHMRVFARQDNTSYESFSPTESIQNALHLVEPQFNAEGIDLQVEMQSDCSPIIGAAVPLEQVLLNVLTNALQAIQERKEGEPDYSGAVHFEISDQVKPGMVAITISDDAGGIPDTEIDRVFDAFYTTKEPGAGTGLGLSISSQIVTSMKGTLTVANVDGGAKFEIMLPVAANIPKNDDEDKKLPSIEKTKPCDVTPHKVMVVDDEDLAVKSLAEILERRGYEVFTAGDGLSALELYRSNPVDAVITDLTMPRMGGKEMIRHLRDIRSDLPIIVTTGQITMGDDENEAAEGATCVLKKPMSMRQIFQALEQVIAA